MPSPLIKILIVDDEEDICFSLSRNLSKRNITTMFTHTLFEASKILKAEKPSILLLDNHLPDGLGINFIDEVKEKFPDTKVIMITAHDSAQDRASAYKKGASYFISKPFTFTEINTIIDELLKIDGIQN